MTFSIAGICARTGQVGFGVTTSSVAVRVAYNAEKRTAVQVVPALVRELALQSQLLGRDGAQWQLRVERETLNHTASRERLQAALLAAGHGDVKLNIEIGPVSDSPARRLAVKAAEKMLAAQELIQNDPLVQAMVRDFGAKIVPGSIQLI